MSSSSKKKKESGKKEKAGGGAGVNWPSPGSGVAAGGGLPEQTKSRLWELFGAIEREFEQLHADNAARKMDIIVVCIYSIQLHTHTLNIPSIQGYVSSFSS